jgi:hypothetical protein
VCFLAASSLIDKRKRVLRIELSLFSDSCLLSSTVWRPSE